MSDSNWGKGVINGIGWGQLATNDIGAGSIYSVSHSGETLLIGTSAAFSYSANTFTQADADPTPTITGTTGGTFSGTSGLVFVSTSTGEIDLSASTIASHVVTYTVDGVSADFSLSVTAAPFSNQFSFEFDGIDEIIELNNQSFGLTSAISVSVWVQVPSGEGAGDFGFRYIVNEDRAASQSTRNWGIFWRGTHAGNVTAFIIDSSGVSCVAGVNFAINDGAWHHLMLTYTGDTSTDGLKLFINSNELAQGTSSNGGIYNNDSRVVPTIGAISRLNNNPNPPVTGRMFKGKIDEVAIWDSDQSSNVNSIYNSGVPNDISSLSPLHWYRMGEEAAYNSGTGIWTLTDQGSGGSNAVSVNMEESDRKSDTP